MVDDMSNMFYVCASCRKQVKDVFVDSGEANKETKPVSYIQPDGGIEFVGAGAYGSRFDMSKNLHIVVCDDCVQDLLNINNGVFQENRSLL